MFRITNSKEAMLQMFRSICCEIKRNEISFDITQKTQKAYLEGRNSNYKSLLNMFLRNRAVKVNLELQDICVDYFEKSSNKFSETISQLEYYRKWLWEQINGIKNEKQMFFDCCKFDTCIPVALSGYTSINDQYYFLNVIPALSYTIIIFMSDKSNLASNYWNACTSSGINMINSIEAFMVFSSDNWYIKKSVWNNLGYNRQQYILAEILLNENRLTNNSRFSIFDDLREEIILENKGNKDSNIINFLEAENKKLSYYREIKPDEIINHLWRKLPL